MRKALRWAWLVAASLALAPLAVIENARPRLGGTVAEATTVGPDAMTGLEVIKATYDFAVDGGAVGAINLMAGSYVPSGFVVMTGLVDVRTVPTSGGAATIAISVEGANDLINAAAIGGAPWSSTGRKSLIPVGTGAASVKTTAARNIVATVATAALTAGVFDVYLIGFRS